MKLEDLSQEQASAVNDVQAFLFSDEPIMAIDGFSGTGKTTLLQYLQGDIAKTAEFRQALDPLYIAQKTEFTATTNPAAEALSTDKILASTIYSLLSMRLVTNYSTGEKELQLTNTSPHPSDKKNHVIFVDEAGYLNLKNTNTIEYVLKFAKIIYVGDPYQLIDFDSKESYVFSRGLPTTYLTKPLRYENEELQALVLGLRQNVMKGTAPNIITNNDSIFHMERDQFDLELIGAIENHGPESTRLLAYHNARVDYYNSQVNRVINNSALPIIGQQVLSSDYCKNGKYSIKNNEQLKILDQKEGTSMGGTRFKPLHDATPGRMLSFTKQPGVYWFTPDDPGAKKRMFDLAISNKRPLDAEYINTCWVSLKPVYASTVHKSQGSSFDYVFVDLQNINECPNANTVLRLLYVGAGRARKKVIFTGDLTHTYVK